MIVTLSSGRIIRGEVNGNGGPCTTVARASDVVRFRRRSGEAVVVYPRETRDLPFGENFEKLDPDAVVRLEAETTEEAGPGRRREPRALAVWEPEPDDDPEPARADWSRALPPGGWA